MASSGPVLVAYDDSPGARAALRWGLAYATERELELVLVYAFSSLAELELAAIQVDTTPLERRVHELLDGPWSEPVRGAGVKYRTVARSGRPADVILAAARDEHAQLIVLGMTERGVLHDLVLGQTHRHVVHEARRPVVAVPSDWSAPAA
jgi:nucleotide-binding universal stress UspA family protein